MLSLSTTHQVPPQRKRHPPTHTDVHTEAIHCLHCLSNTDIGIATLWQYDKQAMAAVERFVQQHGDKMGMETRSMCRDLVLRCKGPGGGVGGMEGREGAM